MLEGAGAEGTTAWVRSRREFLLLLLCAPFFSLSSPFAPLPSDGGPRGPQCRAQALAGGFSSTTGDSVGL